MSHRGDSGRKNVQIKSTSETAAWTAKGPRQECPASVSMKKAYATHAETA
jgi:hypothetical protein